MANRYANLVGANKIKDEYTKINAGFDAVQAEMDAVNAELDQKADRAFARVNGMPADSKDDSLTIAAGAGIAITENPNTKTVTVTATGEAIPGLHGSAHTEFGADPIPFATPTEGGLMSSADKAALDELRIKVADFAVSVVEKGADKTGVADSAPAFQDAFNAIRDNGGGTVYVPYGEYKLGSLLRIYRNTRLIIEPGTRLVRAHDGAMLINGDLGAEYPNYSGNGNIIIDGGIWDGNVTNFPSSFDMFGIARGSNIVIRNAEFRDVVGGHAIDIAACENVLIERCRFLGFIDPGGREFSEAIQIQEHMEEGFNFFGPFDATPCKNITVKNSYFGASGTTGTQAWPVGVGHHSNYHDKFNENVRIVSNVFDGMTYVGVRPFKYNDVVIEDNDFINCQQGVRISAANGNGMYDFGLPQAGKNVIIHNNRFKNIATQHILAAGWEKDGNVAKIENIIISDNVFKQDISGADDCIELSFVHNVFIGKKNFFKNVQRGVYIRYGSSVDVVGNNFENIAYEPIFVDEPDTQYRLLGYTKDHNFSDNFIKGCGRAGIMVQYTNGFKVINNQIYDPATETDNTRNGITCGASASNGIVAGNRVVKAVTGNQNKYGLEITPTCSNVQAFNNNLDGKTGRSSVTTANGCFDGFYIASPNGTRYKVTVTDGGTLSVMAG